MTIELNGSPREVPAGTTLQELVQTQAGSTRGSAVVVDGDVVPRSAWPSYPVPAGARIELITAVQGG